MGTQEFTLTEDEIARLHNEPEALYYLVSWFLCSLNKNASHQFDNLTDARWAHYTTYEPFKARHKGIPNAPNKLVRLAFHHGFIVEAMRCKAALEQLGYWDE